MRGLYNLGNTCYFNTAVQCLAHVPALTKHFFSVPYEGPCEITREYQKVVKNLFIKDKTDPVSPSDLLGAFRVRFPDFAGQGQHDAQEVVLCLLDVFEKSLGKNFISKLFYGEDVQETIWPEGMSTVKTEFSTMLLDVGEPASLKDLMEDRSDAKAIADYVDSTGKTWNVAAVRSRVGRWPDVISFTFAMYDYKFPIEIPLEFEGKKLFACVIHQGIRQGGHYALLVRRWDKWYIKDDESVSEVPQVENLRGPFYMAWYR